MTFKSDGKSTNKDETINEKFTQRPSDDDFSEEDAKKHAEVSENQRNDFTWYFLLGFGSIFVLFFLMNSPKWETEQNNQFRDETLEKQHKLKKELSPFSEA